MHCLEAVAHFNGPAIFGTVLFHQCNDTGVSIIFDIKGPVNREMGCHIHSYGDLRDGCKSLGPHWNPNNTVHGYTFDLSRPSHAGDLVGNILTDSSGNYQFMYKDSKLSLHEPLSIIGRSVVIHDGIDDLGLGNNEESLKTGNAGSRLACSIIGWSNPEY